MRSKEKAAFRRPTSSWLPCWEEFDQVRELHAAGCPAVDAGKRTPVDLEELVAALSRGNPDALLTSPDVTLLRRWVEAELELLR